MGREVCAGGAHPVHGVTESNTQVDHVAAALCALLVWDVRSNGNGTVNSYKRGPDSLAGGLGK